MKKTFTWILAAILCLASALPVSAEEFLDTAGHWAAAEIEFARSAGLIEGDGDGLFRPDDDITRSEFLKIISVIMGYSDGTSEGEMSHWVAPYNDYALHNFLDPNTTELVYNSDGTTLHPGELTDETADLPLERWEMAYLVWQGIDNYLILRSDLGLNFRDTAQITTNYPASIQTVLSNVCDPTLYLFNGDENGNFNAAEHTTRAEAAALTARMTSLLYFLSGIAIPENTSKYGISMYTASSAEPTADGETANDTEKANSTENNENQEKEIQEMAEHSFATVTMEDGGVFKIELMPEYAPATVANFIELAESGFYDGLTFHRIVDGFMAQGGDPLGTGIGGSDKTILGEFSSNGFTRNTLSHTRGVISMARSQNPNSASSQFFICYDDASFLDGQYAAFGKVIEGMEVVDGFLDVERKANSMGELASPVTPIRIKTITISK